MSARPRRGAVTRPRSTAGQAVVAAVAVAVVVMMIVPLPTWLLDLLITVNLAASVTLLVAAVHARDALAMPTLPTLIENLLVVGGSKATMGQIKVNPQGANPRRISWREILRD